jgi:maltooligosyltrehalose trehalohydrolase
LTFRVWAPEAQRVAVVIEGSAHPLGPQQGGWWAGDVDGTGTTTNYLFSVDGGDPRPDPRSAHQPLGVDGVSRVVDHGSFVWTDDSWKGISHRDAIIYELHIGTFTPQGTFDAAAQRIDHLVDLGVTAIEICPVNEFSGEWGWGYDGVDLFAPHHAYGDPDSLKRFVDACHSANLGVILDVVYNHLGPAGNYLGEFGPYFTSTYNTPWGEAVNFDGAGSYEVRRFVVDNALMWLRDYHLDGLRIDAVHAILDRSAIHILEQMAIEVADLEIGLGTKKFLIAESDLNDPRLVTDRVDNGYGLDAQWSDDFHHALHALATGESAGYYSDFGSMEDLAKALHQAFVYDWRYSAFRDRMHGRSTTGLPGHRFLAYSQDHDQVGNRARGDRTSALVDIDTLRLMAALVLTSPFVPMLFMGEEWAATTPFQYFTSHPDEELGRAVREGRRSEFTAFGWDPSEIPDPQDPATFERSKLDWTEPKQPGHAEMLDWYRKLIALRRSEHDLHDFDLSTVQTEFSQESRWLVLTRGTLTIACNFAEHANAIPIDVDAEVLLSSPAPPDGGSLPAHGVAILKNSS